MAKYVIDACIARASTTQSKTSVAILCADFLNHYLHKTSHECVFTQELINEWKMHSSRYAIKWHASMIARRRISPIESSKNNSTLQSLLCCIPELHVNKRNALTKDYHLLHAAIQTDKCIFSLDEKVKKILIPISMKRNQLKELYWINPSLSIADSKLFLNNAKPGGNLFKSMKL